MSTTIHVSQDCMLKILSYLDLPTLGKCCLVNKQWEILASNDALWRPIFPNIATPPQVARKRYITARAVTSEPAILKRLQSFADRIRPNQISSFECLFPFNPLSSIRVDIAHGKCLVCIGEPDIRLDERTSSYSIEVGEALPVLETGLREDQDYYGIQLSEPHLLGLQEMCIFTKWLEPDTPNNAYGYVFNSSYRGGGAAPSYVRSCLKRIDNADPGIHGRFHFQIRKILTQSIKRLDTAVARERAETTQRQLLTQSIKRLHTEVARERAETARRQCCTIS